MKKIFLISMLMIVLSYVSHAQTPGTFSQTATNPTGAISNTSVDTMTYTLRASYKLVSIQPVVTKSANTMTGWAVLDYSVDGTNWKIGTDSLALTNVASQNTVWDKTTAAKYFRIRVGGATTVTGAASAKISAVQ